MASVKESVLAAQQRLAGAVVGAALACPVPTIHDSRALELVLVVLSAAANSIRYVNDALSTAAVAATVIIASGLHHPSTLAAEEQRILYTLVGVGIGVAGTLLTDLLQKRASAQVARQAA
ncbi:hypothetical protein GCM10009790_11370 [Georgenia ruanii]|uniref:Integral membrane bound transporter domain-containing protein n=2 Tax=Georgenia ruanii TaxID=348442 RepID=A0A7J9UVY3_9MICO|nr:hypothetical protein [Georgenia ruanii]